MGNILKKKAKLDGPKSRMVVPNIFVPGENDPAMCPNKDYPNNKIKTTKYTIWTFLPKNLFEQFHRFANIFFLFLVILNWIPELNVFLKEISMFPLIFVLSVTGVKDAYEDFRRYQSDKKVNNLKCKLFSAETGKYENARWQDLKVGDIVHLTCNETIPADLLVLHSSDLSGMCYIETSNIDGENNLKQREVVRGMQGNDCFDPLEFKSSVVCEIPNAHIYQFNGSVNQPNGEQKAINKTNLVLRGCIIRNTDYVEGVLVYTGHETKALLNNRGPGFKRSKLERQVNKDIMWCIVLLIILCFTGAIGGAVWLNQFEENENILYIQFESAEKYNPAYQAFISFWIYLIMLQVIIPMPMYITIEISKMIQVILINQDMDLFHHASNTRIECRALNITEDLGQIQYVFSDKTGTLTENRMVFRCCNIGGFDYTSFPDDEDEPFDQSDEKVDSGQLKLDQQLQYEIDNMNSKKLGSTELSEQSQHIQDFFLLMAICNTVVVSAKPHGEKYAEDEAIPVQKCVISDDDHDAGWSSKLPHRRRKKKRQKRHHTHKTRKVSHVDDSAVDMSGQSDDALMKNFAEGDSDPVSELNNRFLKKSGSLKSHQRDPKHRKTPKSGELNIGYENKNFSHEDTSEKEILTEPKVTEITLCYEAESPDELALVKAAYRYGCRLLRRTVDTVTVWFPSEGEVTLKIHHVLPFDSERKRMSVIIQYPNSSDYVIYTKGADSSVISNLACVKGNLKDEAMIKHVELHLDASSKQGLRTLCMAKKTLKPEEYGMWLQMYRQAELGPFEHKEMALFDAACHLETDLELLGASGIEDNLQDGVPETIAKLRKAGINVWVLTGDKKETALNIAYSCKLIDPEHNIIMLSATKKKKVPTATLR